MLKTNCKKKTANEALWIMQQLENLRLADDSDSTKRQVLQDVALFSMAYSDTFSKDIKKASRSINVMNEITNNYKSIIEE